MTEKALKGRRILIVEDEMMILMMIEDMLADAGCATASAATADQALALIDTQVFDAATLDVNLNGNASYAVADALSKRAVPFVFSTGYGDALPKGYRNRPVLKKPFRHQDLIAIFASLLSNPIEDSG
jgi:CheY-like chemotaxis protein